MGKGEGDRLGSTVAVSRDGGVVGVGAPGNDDGGEDAGQVRVFEFSVRDGSWVQRGGDLNGVTMNDRLGDSPVGMSKHGDVIAIGSEWHQIKGMYGVGHVRVFEYNTTDWVQRGNDIDGTEEKQFFGETVDISADGGVIVIGSPGSHVTDAYFGRV